MQGKFFNIFGHTKKIQSFEEKLRIKKARVYFGNIGNLTYRYNTICTMTILLYYRYGHLSKS